MTGVNPSEHKAWGRLLGAMALAIVCIVFGAAGGIIADRALTAALARPNAALRAQAIEAGEICRRLAVEQKALAAPDDAVMATRAAMTLDLLIARGCCDGTAPHCPGSAR